MLWECIACTTLPLPMLNLVSANMDCRVRPFCVAFNKGI